MSLTHTLLLLSRGKLNPDEFPDGTVIVKEMDVNVETEILSNNSPTEKIINIVQSCVIKPEGANISNLPLVDIMYLLFELRAKSLQREYLYPIQCTHCDFPFQARLILPDDFGIKEAKDDLQDVNEVVMPSGVKLGVRFLRGIDQLEVEKRAKLLLNSKKKGFRPGRNNPENNQNVRNLQYKMRLAKQIVSIDGEEKTPPEIEHWVNTMSLKDSNALKDHVDSATFGLDTDVELVCPSCGMSDYYGIQLKPDFFRPSRGRRKEASNDS